MTPDLAGRGAVEDLLDIEPERSQPKGPRRGGKTGGGGWMEGASEEAEEADPRLRGGSSGGGAAGGVRDPSSAVAVASVSVSEDGCCSIEAGASSSETSVRPSGGTPSTEGCCWCLSGDRSRLSCPSASGTVVRPSELSRDSDAGVAVSVLASTKSSLSLQGVSTRVACR